MRLDFDTPEGPLTFTPTRCLVAGWTGRDAAKVAHHIEELAAIGVPRPSTTPLYYRVPTALITHSETVEVLGEEAGGEVEPVILDDGTRLWLTLGSDHTDRGLEAHSVAHSKAIAPKPIARTAWPLAAVQERLDSLKLSAEIDEGAGWTTYQEGSLAAILPLGTLVEGAGEAAGRGPGTVLFCGTLGAIGGVRPNARFRCRLTDPATGRSIALAYTARSLPVVA